MTGRRWVLVAIGVAGLAWAIGGERLSVRAGTPENHVFDLVVGLVYLGAGLVTIDRRPGNLLGPLMLAYSFTWYLGNWGNADVLLLANIGQTFDSIGTVVLIHMAFAYPTGHMSDRLDRGYVTLAYLWILGSAVLTALVWDPPTLGLCVNCPSAPLALFPSQAVYDALGAADAPAQALLAVAGLGLLGRRWVRASAATRRELIPWSIVVGLLAATFVVDAVVGAVSQDDLSRIMVDLLNVCRVAIPLVLLWGLLESRLARSAIGDLVVELHDPIGPSTIRDALASAVKDPTLTLAFRREGGGWVDEQGRPVDLPGSEASATVTMAGRGQVSTAAVIHDPGLDPALVQAAAAAAALALENAALHAEVRAQLADVQASRARIVEASDHARRRLERDLHDGAQQRLLALSFALRSADRRARVDGADPELLSTLERADGELVGAIAELRDLAHGIHPAILTDEGLAAALEDLAERSPIPIRLVRLPAERVDPAIEATAYFVVAEALSNTAKHAPGATVSVSAGIDDGVLIVAIDDDGAGGADVRIGSGLRGLRDRVAAVNGRLTIDSPPGRGTTLRTEIPCGS